MNKPFIECPYRTHLCMSDYGYWILPSGTILCCTEIKNHGPVVEAYIKGTPCESALSGVIAYERKRDPDATKALICHLFAYGYLKWVRIHIAQSSDTFQITWMREASEKAKHSLLTILDEHSLLDEELETDYGSVIGWKGLKSKLENPTYWMKPA